MYKETIIIIIIIILIILGDIITQKYTEKTVSEISIGLYELKDYISPVSYTHLTLPTILRV